MRKLLFTSLLFQFTFVISSLTHAQVQIGQAINGEAADDLFGWAVSMPNSTTLATGARSNDENGDNAGQVRIFSWDGGAWIQKGSDINGEAAGDGFGSSLDMPDENTVAIGARFNSGNGQDAGHTGVFRWNGNSWVQKGADIYGEAAFDFSGSSMSMPDSNTIAIGAEGNDENGSNSGHVRVFRWSGSVWIQKGNAITGEMADDWCGKSISMPDSNTIAVGSNGNDSNGSNAGHVRVFRWNGIVWIQKGADLEGAAVDDESGWSVSMADSNTVAIGAPGNDENGTSSGQVKVFQWDGTSWVQKGGAINGEALGDFSGFSVSMSDANTLAVGAPLNDGKGQNAGQVRVYVWDGNNWSQKRHDIDGEDSGAEFGFAISLGDPNTLAIGAIKNEINGQDVGQVRVYNVCMSTISLSILKCNEFYTAPSGDTTYTLSGIYTDTLMNSSGCDSIITIDLTIGQVDTSVSVFPSALQATAQNATYQWLDCENGFSEIANATNRAFVPNESGEYAVEVTQLNCADTSQCYRINNVGLAESAHHLGVSLYPNPTKGHVNIQFEQPMGPVTVSITNLQGQVIREEKVSGSDYHVMELPAQGGWYIIRVQAKDQLPVRLRILKL